MPEEANDEGGQEQKILSSYDLPAVEAPRANIPQPQPGPGGWTLPPDPQPWHPADQPDRPDFRPQPPAPPPPPPKAPPGPGPSGGVTGTSPSTAANPGSVPSSAPGSVATVGQQPDVFANFPGPEIDAAKTIVSQFMGWMGWPQGVDTIQLALQVLNGGLANDPTRAYDTLYHSSAFSSAQRSAAPWAQFGMTPDAFNQRSAALDTLFRNLIGTKPGLASGHQAHPNVSQAGPDGTVVHAPVDLQGFYSQLYREALVNNLGQSDILSRLTSNPDVMAAQPWLAVGQTYQQTSQAYSSTYGSAPADLHSLASYFQFNQGTRFLAPTKEAIEVAAPVSSGARSEVR